MEIDTIYFWTATIRNWSHLLAHDSRKEIIVQSLKNLSERKLIDVYAYVVMPNHIHLIWKLNAFNGGELPSASLLKFTAHEFKRILPRDELSQYYVGAANKDFEFWQRDSLATELYSPEVAWQKLNYIHDNPLNEKWNLVKDPCDYRFSSANFYLDGGDDGVFLKHLGDEIG